MHPGSELEGLWPLRIRLRQQDQEGRAVVRHARVEAAALRRRQATESATRATLAYSCDSTESATCNLCVLSRAATRAGSLKRCRSLRLTVAGPRSFLAQTSRILKLPVRLRSLIFTVTLAGAPGMHLGGTHGGGCGGAGPWTERHHREERPGKRSGGESDHHASAEPVGVPARRCRRRTSRPGSRCSRPRPSPRARAASAGWRRLWCQHLAMV